MPPPSSASKKSPYFKSQLSRAAALESDLSEAKSEEKASRIRIQLCGVLSDVILSNPELSLRKDCFGRLWRSCFYQRIGELRSRISREKRRKKSKASLDNLETTLKTFLKEGVTLYKYLVEQYEVKLLPSESQDENEALTTDGVVEGLHRILIYLGDLYRYARSYPKAQECYEQAAKLAPSKGNPYNQLAVVAQLKDPDQPLSCVALYYYARSLLATHDPFPTSKGNLERLLEQNREWLQTTSEQELLEQQTTTYAQRVEQTKAKRAVASRLFLSRLVDIHYDFFTQIKMEERQARDAELVNKMNVVLVKLDALLKEWTFGDSLLVKMVAIHAFSIEWTQSKTLARAFMLQFGAALAERLEYGLKKALEKKSSSSLRLLMPLVLLNDYVSTWNHDADSPDKAVSSQARDFCVSARSRYWTSIASVATQLLPLRNTLGLDEMDVDALSLKEYEGLKGFKPFDSIVNAGVTSDDVYVSAGDAVRLLQLESSQPAASMQPTEANTLKLKRFFDIVDFMVQKKLPVCCVNGQYRVFSLKAGDADEIVDSDDDAQMMEEDDPIVEDTQQEEVIKPMSKPKTPVSLIKEAPKRRSPLSLYEDPAPRVSVNQSTANVLEYKPSEGGAGPALLVPGALLLNKTQEKSPPSAAAATTAFPSGAAPSVASTKHPLLNTTPTITNQMMKPQQFVVQSSRAPPVHDVTMGESNPAHNPVITTERPPVGPPPGLLPPPGFGVAPAATTTLLGTTTSSLQPPPPMAVGYAGVYPPPSTQSLPDGDTILQMLQGINPTTANPFMTTPSVSNEDNLFASQVSPNEDSMDGMSLLDSSLLNSMMMDNDGASKQQSRNPFLT